MLKTDHSPAECWHPHYHRSPFRPLSAEIFRTWYAREISAVSKEYPQRIAPLCEFGGHASSPYVLREHANGTYAVCPKCRQVISSGYDDETGLGPRACPCGARLRMSDYFQPVFKGSGWTEKDLVDPKRDPAVTAAEVCALVPGGIPIFAFYPIIPVLTAEGLLVTGSYVDGLVVNDQGIISRKLQRRMQFSEWVFIDPCSRRFNVRVTDRGRVMLKARGIVRKPGAAKRAKDLLRLDERILAALAQKALAERVLMAG